MISENSLLSKEISFGDARAALGYLSRETPERMVITFPENIYDFTQERLCRVQGGQWNVSFEQRNLPQLNEKYHFFKVALEGLSDLQDTYLRRHPSSETTMPVLIEFDVPSPILQVKEAKK